MRTIGVTGLWGVERIERAGLTMTKLSLTLLFGSAAAHYLLFLLLSGGIPDRSTTEVALFFGFFNGLVLYWTIALARWTQADLEGVMPVAPEIEPSLELLRPNRGLVLGCFLLELVVWEGLFEVGEFGSSVSLGAMLRFWLTPRGVLIGIALPLTLATIWSAALVVVIRQVRALTYAARNIDVDIFELDHYPRLATPLSRFIAFALLVVSVAPTPFFLESAGAPDVILLIGMPALVLGMALLVVSYAYPVWVLRGRIRAAKRRELDCVFRSLRGEERAMSGSRLGSRAESLGFSEILDYRSFVESLWDWPLAPHVQGILLFGLLPPTTWVLAALIENAVSAVVGRG